VILLTLEPNAADCRLELDGVDVSKRIRGVAIEANVGELTVIRLTILDSVTVVGEPGRFEFVRRDVKSEDG
jgi:hypothetical protein